MTGPDHPRILFSRAFAGLVVAVAATSCATPPESPWAEAPDVNELQPVEPGPDPIGNDDREPGGDHAVLTDGECADDEARCGLASVPQTTGATDRVTLEYRVIVDTGDGIPVVHLHDGSESDLLTPEGFPERPLLALGSRGVAPGRPNLTCPEFQRAPTGAGFGEALAECIDRLALAGIDPAGTLPSQLGADAGLTISALGYDEVDLVVTGGRALSVAGIAEHVRVRRVVYVDPWLATDRSIAAATATHASIEAVWSRCAQIAGCSTPGTADDFLAAVAGLEDRPLDDVRDTFSETNLPIDARRLMDAIVSTVGQADSLAFLPEIHRAILARDAGTISAFVQQAFTGSTDVNAAGVSCTLFAAGLAPPGSLPSPLRETAADRIELVTDGCAVWPAETPVPQVVPGLTVLTRSTPIGGPDHDAAVAGGPVIIEPTVGAPSAACARVAAATWFERGEVDDSACTTPLSIRTRDEAATATRVSFELDDVTVELSVPDTWTDSGYGSWWRDADPIDPTYLSVFLWDNDDANSARGEIALDWGVTDAELSATQLGDRIWLLATGPSEYDTVYLIAVGRFGNRTIAAVLETTAAEADSLSDEVLLPALRAMAVG